MPGSSKGCAGRLEYGVGETFLSPCERDSDASLSMTLLALLRLAVRRTGGGTSESLSDEF